LPTKSKEYKVNGKKFTLKITADDVVLGGAYAHAQKHPDRRDSVVQVTLSCAARIVRFESSFFHWSSSLASSISISGDRGTYAVSLFDGENFLPNSEIRCLKEKLGSYGKSVVVS
jgi:hypothetical protein